MIETCELTREERIKQYAWNWYQFRIQNNRPGTPEQDWAKAEHMVDAEDRTNLREAQMKYVRQHSKMKC